MMGWRREPTPNFVGPPLPMIERVERRADPEDLRGFYRGRHYLDWISTFEQLKREKRYHEAREILIGLVEVTEREAAARGWNAPPAYRHHLGIVERAIERERKRAETEAGKAAR